MSVLNVKYIPVESLLSTVKLKLRSFDESGLINESALISVADRVLSRTGYSIEQHKTLVLDVYDGKVEIPEDLLYVQAIYRSDLCQENRKRKTQRFYFGNPVTFRQVDFVQKLCYNKCEIQETAEVITRSFYVEKDYYEDSFCGKTLLRYNRTVPTEKIPGDCPNIFCKSEDYFTLKNNTLYFNFDEGFIVLKYTGKAIDDEGYPLIEDDPMLIAAIEDAMVVEALETIYYNGEVDVLQRLQLARAEAAASLTEARALKQTPSHASLIRYAKGRRKSQRKLN